MWMTCALLTALATAPGQAGDVKLTNVKAIKGPFGEPRTDKELVPGDVFFVSFDIEGLQADENGKVQYTMTLEFTDSKGDVKFKDNQQKLEAYTSLGGSRLPATAHAEVGLDTPEGEYKMKVTVSDASRKDKKEVSFEEKFKVKRKDFAVVRPLLTYFPSGLPGAGQAIPSPPQAVVGQSLVLNCLVVGFERDKSEKKLPNLTVEFTVLDEAKKPTTSKPSKQVVTELPGQAPVIDLHWPIDLNRPGKFTIRLKVTDEITKKSRELSVPITVQEVK